MLTLAKSPAPVLFVAHVGATMATAPDAMHRLTLADYAHHFDAKRAARIEPAAHNPKIAPLFPSVPFPGKGTEGLTTYETLQRDVDSAWRARAVAHTGHRGDKQRREAVWEAQRVESLARDRLEAYEQAMRDLGVEPVRAKF